MSAMEITLWSLVMAGGLIGSALFSGLETGLYSVNRVRLAVHSDRRRAGLLRFLIQRPVELLSTLLLANNIANYLGTAALTVLLERGAGYTEGGVLLLNLLIITPVLFVFGETLPKDLFARFADTLMYRFAAVLNAVRLTLKCVGLTPLIMLVQRWMTRLMGQAEVTPPVHPRRQVEALMREGVGMGLISDEQSMIVQRVLSLSDRKVRDEMVSWSQVITVKTDDDPAVLRDLADRTSRSRFPVVESDATKAASGESVIGVIDLYDALLHEEGEVWSIREAAQPALSIDADTPQREALRMMQQQHKALAIVTSGGKPVGVATIKDLVEPITGDLVNW